MEEVVMCPKCEELLDCSLLSEADEETRSAFNTDDLDLSVVSGVSVSNYLQTSSDLCDGLEELEVFQLRLQNELVDKSTVFSWSGYGPPKLPYCTIKEVMLVCISNAVDRVPFETKFFPFSRLPGVLDNVSHLGRVSKKFLVLFQQSVEIFCYRRTFYISSSDSILSTVLDLRHNPLCPLLSLPFKKLCSNMFFDATLRSVSSFPSNILRQVRSLSLPLTAQFDFLHDSLKCHNLHHLEIHDSNILQC
ncbi:hypothetical protein GEMRC1_009765 [Eukaryota sp. GEM-RC1]